MSPNPQSPIYTNIPTEGPITMSTINISFDPQLPSLRNEPQPESKEQHVSTLVDKKSGLDANERRAQYRNRKQKERDDKHPLPTKKESEGRLRILAQEHNMLMLKRISREHVRGADDRSELVTVLLIELGGARCNTPQAQASALLDTPDGTECRRVAHTIISNMARNAAAKMITVRDREVCSDFTEVQRQAVTSAFKHDGKWGKTDYDSRSTINRELAWRSGDPQGFEWTDMEFRRGSERISEITVGGNAYNDKGRVMIHKENTLATMLTDSLRIHDLHDWGRLDRVDGFILKDWYRRFVHMVPSPTSKDPHDFIKVATARADWLGTTNGRQAAALVLFLTQGAKWSDDRQILMDILRGEVFSLGSLAVACTSGTKARGQKRSKDQEDVAETETYMLLRVTPMLRVLGFEATSGQRSTINKVLKSMAIEAGAGAEYDKHATYKSQLVRFGSSVDTPTVTMHIDSHKLANDGQHCGCGDSLFFDGSNSDYKTHRCSMCRTRVRITSIWADRETSVKVQGLPMFMELRGERYGAMNDLVCWLSGTQYVPFNKAKDIFTKKEGAAAVDNYLVHGSWPGMKLRGS